jgi:hypothetical protein
MMARGSKRSLHSLATLWADFIAKKFHSQVIGHSSIAFSLYAVDYIQVTTSSNPWRITLQKSKQDGIMALLTQIFALILLFAAIWFGAWRWIRPHAATITLAGRGLLLLVIATLTGGFIGSPFWWMDLPSSFSWDLPPFASRMLAAAGWSFFVVSWLALRRPTYRRLRLILLLLFVYLVPLGMLILLFHLDRFDFSAPITYGFFAIAIPMGLAATGYLLRQPRILADDDRAKDARAKDDRDTFPANVVLQVWLNLVAVITGLWALALLVTDSGPSSLIWAWPGDLLSSRLIGVMLLTIACGALYSFRHGDTSQLMLAMIAVYSLGVTAASAWGALAGMPIKTLYTAVFSVIFIVTAVLLVSHRQPRPIRAVRPVI